MDLKNFRPKRIENRKYLKQEVVIGENRIQVGKGKVHYQWLTTASLDGVSYVVQYRDGRFPHSSMYVKASMGTEDFMIIPVDLYFKQIIDQVISDWYTRYEGYQDVLSPFTYLFVRCKESGLNLHEMGIINL